MPVTVMNRALPERCSVLWRGFRLPAYLRALKTVASQGTTDLFDRLPHSKWYREALEELLRKLRPSPRDVLLDVGSGAGWFALWSSQHAGKVVGVDMSSAMVRRAEINRGSGEFGEVTFVQGDVYSLPFPDSHFDIVTGTMLLPALSNPAAAVVEIVRVLRPGGKIALLLPAPALVPSAAARLAKARKLTGTDGDTLVAWSIFGGRRFTEADLRDLLAPHSPVTIAVVPLLEDMAFIAVISSRGEKGH